MDIARLCVSGFFIFDTIKPSKMGGGQESKSIVIVEGNFDSIVRR